MKLLTFCLFFICFFALTAPAQEKWDIKRCVDYAIVNNISVKQADLQSRFSKLQLEQNKLSQLPNANVQSNAGYRFGRSENPTTGVLEDNNFFNIGAAFSSNVSLFNWFSKRFTIEGLRLEHEADLAQIAKVQNDIALNVAAGYLQVLLAKEQNNIAEVQVAQTAAQLEVTRKQVEAGKLPELNAAELEAQLARDSASLVNAQANVQQLLLQLKAILNMDAGSVFDVATPPVDAIPVENLADLQPEQVYNLAVINLPQQKVTELRLRSSHYFVKAARSSMYPTFSAYGNLGSNYVNIKFPKYVFVPQKPTGATVLINGIEYPVLAPGANIVGQEVTPFGRQFQNNFGQNIGIGVNIPILNGGVLRTAWRRSQLDVRRYELQREQDNLILKQDIYKAYNDAIAAIQRYNANKKTVAATEKAYNFAQKRYNLGLVSTYDIINSQNNLLRARTELVYAQYDYVFKLKLLEFYKGQGLKL
ncbi:MAG: TolC family protein [Bacteroidota bacterium]|nr:TolC family protein [Bacteroidota bacterium]